MFDHQVDDFALLRTRIRVAVMEGAYLGYCG